MARKPKLTPDDGLAFWVTRSAQKAQEKRWTRDWVWKQRQALIRVLGGRCYVKACSSTEGLCFDHWKGRTWQIRAVNQKRRIIRIRREAAEGLIRLLCRKHSASHKPGISPIPLRLCRRARRVPFPETGAPF